MVLEGVWHLEVGRAEVALDPDGMKLPVFGEQPNAAQTLATLQTLALLIFMQTQRVQVANRAMTMSAPDSFKFNTLVFMKSSFKTKEKWVKFKVAIFYHVSFSLSQSFEFLLNYVFADKF